MQVRVEGLAGFRSDPLEAVGGEGAQQGLLGQFQTGD
jgi:hypothetical protein